MRPHIVKCRASGCWLIVSERLHVVATFEEAIAWCDLMRREPTC